jgi:hypothetical protein
MDTFLGFVEHSDLSMWIRGEFHAGASDHHHVAITAWDFLHVPAPSSTCASSVWRPRGCADAHQAYRWHDARNVGGRTHLRPDAHVVRLPLVTDQPDALPAIQLDDKALHQNIIQKPGVVEMR